MASSNNAQLESEFRHFQAIQSNLRKEHPEGGHVVIRGNTVLGVWKTRNEALESGLEAFGNVVFLVRNILDDEDRLANFSFNSIA